MFPVGLNVPYACRERNNVFVASTVLQIQTSFDDVILSSRSGCPHFFDLGATFWMTLDRFNQG